MTFVYSVILQFIAFGVILAEVVIPSGGLLSLLSVSLLGFSLYLVFSKMPVHVLYYFIVADVIIIPIIILFGFRLLSKSPAALHKVLSSKNGVISHQEGLDKLVGRNGQTMTDLRPSGTIQIDGKRFDALSKGEYIEKQVEVTVIGCSSGQLQVRKK